MVNKKSRKIIDISMTLLLILIGIIIIKFWIEIVGWVIIIISLMARHKEIIEFIKYVPKSIDELFGGSKGQNVEKSKNVFKARDVHVKGNIVLGDNNKSKSKRKKQTKNNN